MVLNLKSSSFSYGRNHADIAAMKAAGRERSLRISRSLDNERSGSPVVKSPPPTKSSKFSFERLFSSKKSKKKKDLPARPPPIKTDISSNDEQQSQASRPVEVRLCQSPRGRANVQLAIPVTPTSRSTQRASVPTSPLNLSILPRESSEVLRESTVDEFLACFPRDLVPDVRCVCLPSNRRAGRQYVRTLIAALTFEIRSTKWGNYFLLLVRRARSLRHVSSEEAISLKWVICAHVQREVLERKAQKQAHQKAMQKKMTEYRVALQCICSVPVLKYGRKGKPHLTQLTIENGHTLRWTSKLLPQSSKKHIALASIMAIRVGASTDVLKRALQKGTLDAQEARQTLSIVTPTRTLDIKARSVSECEWLHRSFSFLVDLAREHEKHIAQQVELSIMQRIETIHVLKHGRKGKPHKTRLFVNRFGEISWLGRSNDTILIDDIQAIELGHQSAVFQRSLSHGHASASTSGRCFSLVTHTRTLDVEAENEYVRDWFVVAFRYLIDKVQEKTAALKREKAEKQLKILHQLCGGMGLPSPTSISTTSPANMSFHTPVSFTSSIAASSSSTHAVTMAS